MNNTELKHIVGLYCKTKDKLDTLKVNYKKTKADILDRALWEISLMEYCRKSMKNL